MLLEEFNDNLKESLETKLNKNIELKQADENFNYKDLYITENKWYKFDDVIAVAFDIEKSTKLNGTVGKIEMPKIYDTAMSSAVKIFRQFKSNFIEIQGDGGFALFWGKERCETALTAAITLQTFNNQILMPSLKQKYQNHRIDSRGFRIGVSDGFLISKFIGKISNDKKWIQPVWSGQALNFAVKTAQQAVPDSLIVTGSVYKRIKGNEFLVLSCGCNGNTEGNEKTELWVEHKQLENIPAPWRNGPMALEERFWCKKHGSKYINDIVGGGFFE